MEKLVQIIQSFTSLFDAGAETLLGMMTGILPSLAVLMITINALIAFIGEEKVEAFAQKGARFTVVRYVILPVVGMFTMPNPGAGVLGRFLKEEHKAAYLDTTAAVSHPMTSIFPHVNPGELFIWLGIAQGIETLGLSTIELAIRYIAAGMILALFRGIATEKVFIYLQNQRTKREEN